MDADSPSMPAEVPHRGRRGATPARPADPPPVSLAVDVEPSGIPLWRVAIHLLLPGAVVLAFAQRLTDAQDVAGVSEVLHPAGPLGWLLIALMAGSLAGFVFLARQLRSSLHVLLAMLVAALLLRGLHEVFDQSVMPGLIKADVWRRAWQATFLFTIIYGWWRRAGLRRELKSFVRRPGFWLLFTALLIGGVLGEVLAERDLWRLLARPEFKDVARLAMQQLLALVGFLLLVGGAFEELLQFRNRRAVGT